MSSLLLQDDPDQSGIELDPIGPKEDDELAKKSDELAKKPDKLAEKSNKLAKKSDAGSLTLPGKDDENDGDTKERGSKGKQRPEKSLIQV